MRKSTFANVEKAENSVRRCISRRLWDRRIQDPYLVCSQIDKTTLYSPLTTEVHHSCRSFLSSCTSARDRTPTDKPATQRSLAIAKSQYHDYGAHKSRVNRNILKQMSSWIHSSRVTLKTYLHAIGKLLLFHPSNLQKFIDSYACAFPPDFQQYLFDNRFIVHGSRSEKLVYLRWMCDCMHCESQILFCLVALTDISESL